MSQAMLTVILFVLIATPCAAITISEIHFDPAGEDRGNEFIEIRMDDAADLSGFIVADAASNDTLIPVRITNGTFAIIAEDTFNTSHVADNASVYSAGARIGNGLGNTGDAIFLLDQNRTIMANTSYDGSVGGDGIPLIWINGSWAEGTPGGTPGWEEATPSLPVMNTTNETDASGNSTNMTGVHNKTMGAKENLTDDPTEDPACATYFLIVTNDAIVDSGERILFWFNFSDEVGGFGITYGIEDVFGDVRKSLRTTTNRAPKSYTPKTDARVDALIIKAKLDAPCLERPKQAEKMLIVTNQDAAKRNDDETDDAAELRTRKPEPEGRGRSLAFDLVNETLAANQSVPFVTALSIRNDDEPHVFTIWSYAYKGSVSYSGDREANRQTITMNAGEHRFATLRNLIDAPAGQANYKIRIQKDDLKTPYEITRDLLILPKDRGDAAQTAHADSAEQGASASEEKHTARAVPGDVLDMLPATARQQNQTANDSHAPASAATAVFSSAPQRALGLAMPLFLGALSLCVITLIWAEPYRPKRNI